MVGNALVPQQPMREFSDTNFPTPKYNERVSLLTAAALLYRQRSMACLIISTASAYSYCSRGNTSGLCCADLAVRDENPTRKPARKPRKQDLRKEQILEFCVEPQYLSDILQHLGLKDRENLMEVYINPMIGTGVLEMTEPDNPTSRNNGKSGTRTSKVSL